MHRESGIWCCRTPLYEYLNCWLCIVSGRLCHQEAGDARMPATPSAHLPGAKLEDLAPGARVKGVISAGVVTVIDTAWHGSNALTLTYGDDSGGVAQALL